MTPATQEDSIMIGGTDKITLYDLTISEGSSFDCSPGIEKRSFSEEERIVSEGSEDRKSPDTFPSPQATSLVACASADSLTSQTTSLVACASLTSSASLSTRSLPVLVSPDRPDRDLSQASWKSDSCLMHHENYDDEIDDMSCASGHSYSSFCTTASSESVQDIISRLQSETDRRRRRLMRRRSRRGESTGVKSTDVLQKYNTSLSDPKLGIMVEIKE
mmetsp:Transcript_2249/g.3438  ORF Transcript_2249/g.3438 Transcript_2249/m.3438 type:complete len:218 (+) Transcript_2249:92-745(+)